MIHDASWKLPDPFLKEDGNRISSKEEWGAQRIRFLDMLEKMFYGKMPPRPEHLEGERLLTKRIWDGKVLCEKVRLKTGPNEEIGYHVHVTRPNRKGKTIPIVIPAGTNLEDEILKMAVYRNFSIMSFEIG